VGIEIARAQLGDTNAFNVVCWRPTRIDVDGSIELSYKFISALGTRERFEPRTGTLPGVFHLASDCGTLVVDPHSGGVIIPLEAVTDAKKHDAYRVRFSVSSQSMEVRLIPAGAPYESLEIKETELENEIVDQNCIVCLDPMKAGEKIHSITGCKHSFHARCLRRWATKKPECPQCITPIAKKTEPLAVDSLTQGSS
jgi:hypothetical protein